ncbi:TIGR01212 family radical SAM protein [Candidatus Auribacterota bacterium]
MKRYRDLNSYLKEKFKVKIYKIALDAGFSCPNKDGLLSSKGCIFCSEGSAAVYIDKSLSIADQISNRIRILKKKDQDAKFIAYFQAFSNTYAPLFTLEKVYKESLAHEDVVGLSLGTRPDCIDKAKLDLIAQFSEKKEELWIEYGLQSMHEKTLKLINRGHSLEDFKAAVKMTQARGIKICAHMILGLPQESKADMLNTAKFIADLNIEGIKIHLLHVIKDTLLEQMYLKKEVSMLSQKEYVQLVCDILEILPPEMIIHRLTGEADKKIHIAPLWALNKGRVLKDINDELVRRDSYQGRKI